MITCITLIMIRTLIYFNSQGCFSLRTQRGRTPADTTTSQLCQNKFIIVIIVIITIIVIIIVTIITIIIISRISASPPRQDIDTKTKL